MHSVDLEVMAWLDRLLDAEAGDRERMLTGLAADRPGLHAKLVQMLAICGSADASQWLLGPLRTGPQVHRALQAGDLVAGYRLLRELGRGGMSVVWLAERSDGSVRRQVALKMPLLAMLAGTQADRFAREKDALSCLSHPHIARLYDAGIAASGQAFIVLEFVDGATLTEHCDSRQLTVAERVQLFLQVLAAVDHAHAHLIVHRDIKPSNVLVDSQGQVKLLDFGIAKLLAEAAGPSGSALTQQTGLVLTPRYAAPEQVSEKSISTATDVYSLGVVLFELLTGARPYAQNSDAATDVMHAVLHEDPLRPSRAPITADAARARGLPNARRLRAALAGDLDVIVLKALRKAPEQRYGSVDRFADDLKRYLAHQPIAARPPSMAYSMRCMLRRNPAVAAVAVAVVAGLASTLVLYFQVLDARSATEAQAAVARSVNDYLVRDLLAAANPMSSGLSATGANAQQPGQVPVRALLDRAAEQAGKRFTGQPALEAAVRISLSEAYFGIAAYPESAKQALIAHEGLSGLVPRNLLAEARALNLAAEALREADDYDAADTRLKQALAVIASSEPNGTDYARLLAEIRLAKAKLLYSKGSYPEAISMLQSEVPALRSAFGAVSHQVAEALVQLTLNQQQIDDLPAALSSARKALEIRLQIDGPDHPRTIESHLRLAEMLRLSGQVDEAERQSRKAFEMGRSLLGPDHSITLTAQNHLANVLYQTNRLDEAIKLFEDATARFARTFGEKSADTNAAMNNLGLAYANAGRMTEAVDMLKSSLTLSRQLLGPDHFEVVVNELNLADVLADAGRWNEALAVQQPVVARAPAVFGPAHAFTAGAHRVLGRILMHLGRWTEARAELLEARRLLTATLDAQHPKVQAVDQLLAEFNRKAPRKYRRAETTLASAQ